MTERNPGLRPRASSLWWASITGLFLLHFLSFPFREHAIVTDVRHYLYFASRVADGAVPHRDFFELKTPLATFAGAAAHLAGRQLGVDPLLAVRVEYLVLAAAAGVAAFAVHRRLWRGSAVAALVAVAPVFGFSVLGLMPCIGNIPKMLMALCASVAALLAHHGWWRAAGVCAVLAFMDWQPGALLLLALVLGAAVQPAGGRSPAFLGLGQGVLLGVLPFAVYYAWHGALAEVVGQTVGAALFRGTSAWQKGGIVADWTRLLDLTVRSCPGQQWLLVAACVGQVVWARHVVRPPRQSLPVILSGYHYGVVAFSLLDFQGYGDVFILLHSLAFFAGAAFAEVALLPTRRAGADPGRYASVLARVAAATLAVAAAQPWVSRGTLVLEGPTSGGRVTLSAQRALAPVLAARLRDRSTTFLGPSEQLYLLDRANRGPLVYWTAATYSFYRRSPQETPAAVLARVLQSSGPEVVVCDHAFPLRSTADIPVRAVEALSVGAYAVDVYELKDPEHLPRELSAR